MIEITIVQKPSNVEYLTVAECLRRNGYRHYCNGMKYLEQGMTQHARGSFVKAQRNYDRSQLISYWPLCINTLANNVAKAILNG